MRILTNVSISGSMNLASSNKDSFTIGTPIENSDENVDNLYVYANADFRNNVIIGSSRDDVVQINGAISGSVGALTASSLEVSGTIKALGFEQVFNTTAPNATTPVLGFMTTGSQTSIDIVLGTKGEGAIARQIANSLASGGNKRGLRSVDFQVVRDFATQVASGQGANIIGGQKSTNTGFISTINAGADCVMAASTAYIGGGSVSRIDSGADRSFIGSGFNNRINTNNAYAFIGTGEDNHTDASYTAIVGGSYANTRGVIGRQSWASGRFAARGDAQIGTLVTRMSSSNGTPVILTSDGSGTPVGTAGSANVNVLPNNSTYKVRAEVTAREPATKDSKAWTLECLVTRGANAAATAIDGTIISSSFGAASGSAAWDATLVANTTQGSIEVQCTGEAAKTIRWVARTDTVEVQG
jgi:hypothetical protein